VFLLAYSIQLLLPFVFLVFLTYVPYRSMPSSVRQIFHGIICPEYWLQGGKVLMKNRALVGNDPSMILETRMIYCNDVFNNLLVLLTFGLCSPVLAVAVACSVLLKMSLWVLLLGRFTRCLLDNNNKNNDGHSDATTIAAPSAPTTALSPSQYSKSSKISTRSGVADKIRDDVVHFALMALAETHIPLFEVLAGSFWRLVWCSALFVALLSWDMATDEVGWLKSLWAPLVPLGYAIMLRCVAYFFCNNSRESKQESAADKASLHQEGAGVSQNPLHEHVDTL
jgi:hypothetical protein